MHRFSIILLIATCACEQSLFAETAHSPGVATYASWEPFLNGAKGLGPRAFNNLKEQIDTPNTQGYRLQRRHKNNQAAADAGDCTRANWDGFARAIGIALIKTHGSAHSIIGISTSDGAVALEWIDGGTDNKDMKLLFSQEFDSYIVRVRSKWLERNFAPFFNNTESIVYMDGCQTARSTDPGDKEVFNAVGGRFAIGYTNNVTNVQSAQDLKTLFLYMNGLEPAISKGLWRLASQATTAPGYSSGFTFRISGETTLCPAVAKPTLSSIFPHGSGAAQSGDGKIIFDTKVDTIHVDAKDALTFSPSGTVDFTNIHWNGDHEIDFHWNASPASGGYDGNFSVIATAVAAKVIAFPGGQQLDGGDLSGSETDPDGFAPNAVDFKWKFYK